jgi:predicted MFS family arabinose efflux permease
MATNLAQTLSITIGAALVDTIGYKPLLIIVAIVATAAIPAMAFPAQPPARPALAIRDPSPAA